MTREQRLELAVRRAGAKKDPRTGRPLMGYMLGMPHCAEQMNSTFCGDVYWREVGIIRIEFARLTAPH